ncbi:MAG: ATP-dependent DNA helicase [Acidobacteriota bacterium]
MAPRFDADAKTLTLAVADLLDAQLRRSLGFANRGGYERLWLGQAIHSRYQEQALAEDPTYRREVVLRHTFEHRGWTVTVFGRCDGLRRAADGTLVVEEIKSVRRGVALPPPTRALYQRQVELYVWLLDRLMAADAPVDGAASAPRRSQAADLPWAEDVADALDALGVDADDESDTVTAPDAAADPDAPTSSDAAAPLRGELILIEIGTDAIERHAVDVRPRAVGAGVRRRLNELIRAWQVDAAARDARVDAAETLTFPHPTMRPGQDGVIERVEAALAAREHVLVEAPTGIGKTAAALWPAVRHALAHDKRVYVLTAKTLQQELAAEVLTRLNDAGVFSSLRLRAKRKMCANDQVICHEDYCVYARDYYLKMQETRLSDQLAAQHPTLLPDMIYRAAVGAQVCPFEVSLDLEGRAQVVVCDYNYAFDPYVSLGAFGRDADLGDVVLVVDEIHNLVGRGRGYYSPTLSAKDAHQAAESLDLVPSVEAATAARVCRALARVIEDAALAVAPPGGEAGLYGRAHRAARQSSLFDPDPADDPWGDGVETGGGLFDETPVDAAIADVWNPSPSREIVRVAPSSGRGGGWDAGGRRDDPAATQWAIEQRPPEDDLWTLRARLDRAFIDYLEQRRSSGSLTADDPFVELYFGTLRFLNVVVVSKDPAFSSFVERDGDEVRLRLLCKDPSRFLGAVINRCHSVIGLSATLSPVAFYRDLLGFDASRTDHLRVASPFPAENRRVVIDRSVQTTWRERPRNYPKIAERLADFADAVPGNCLALFPSYRFLAEVAARLDCRQKRVLTQSRSDGDAQREAILETLRSALMRDILLLAVAGGVFAEGVDYPGDMLQAVAVVGPCLPAVSLEQELLKRYYDERFDKGFEYAFVVPGMTRVVQAAGRLIRSPEDIGVIALFDQRFLRRPYASHLPPDWAGEDGALRDLVGEPAAAADAFFRMRYEPDEEVN